MPRGSLTHPLERELPGCRVSCVFGLQLCLHRPEQPLAPAAVLTDLYLEWETLTLLCLLCKASLGSLPPPPREGAGPVGGEELERHPCPSVPAAALQCSGLGVRQEPRRQRCAPEATTWVGGPSGQVLTAEPRADTRAGGGRQRTRAEGERVVL